MTLFKRAAAWTGETFSETDVLERPAIRSAALKADAVVAGNPHLVKEYASLAAELGVAAPHLEIERFRAFLEEKSITVFALAEVVKYMDEKAKKEADKNSGWRWRPLRETDHIPECSFGSAGRWENQIQNGFSQSARMVEQSDYYRGPHKVMQPEYAQHNGQLVATGRKTEIMQPSEMTVYDQTIPLHALRKVSLINKEFDERVKLFVCDYAPVQTIQYADPFLLAVVPNPAVDRAVGRFVIDFWDEPGFGLDKQLA